MLSKEDWQNAFGRPTAAFDARVQQTLNHLEEEKPMKLHKWQVAILVFALVLTLSGVVYAAANGWMIGDYFDQRYGDNVNAPKNFSTGYDQDYTQELDGLTFRIRDAIVDGGQLNAIVEISRADGKQALFLGEDIMEDDPIGSLYIREMDQDDPAALIPVAQYAREHGLPMYSVGTAFIAQGSGGAGAGDYWMEEDQRLAYFIEVNNVPTEGDHADFVWQVYKKTEDGEFLKTETNITLPVAKSRQWDVQVNEKVEGLPVILDAVHLRQGIMGLYVDMDWHVEAETDPDMAQKIQRNDVNLWFRIIDPETGNELPGGPTLGGETGSPDDVHFSQKGDSLSDAFTGDTLYLQAYDAWEKTRFGMVTVKIK